ncbi:MAG: SDR family oxidoreductase [Oscillospiraceae bacterium]
MICSGNELLVKRWGQPEDVAEAVWTFCSGALIYSPGQVIVVDGGYAMRRL